MVPPKAVLTRVLAKKGKMVKVLQMPLKGHLKKTNENSYQRHGISEHPPSDQSCTALGTQTTCRAECSSPTSYGSPAVALRESTIKGLPHENSKLSHDRQRHVHLRKMRCCIRILCSQTPRQSQNSFPVPALRAKNHMINPVWGCGTYPAEIQCCPAATVPSGLSGN